MLSSKLIRWSGLAAMLGGLLWSLTILFHRWPFYYEPPPRTFLVPLILMVGLSGLYAKWTSGRLGKTCLILVAIIGVALAAAGVFGLAWFPTSPAGVGYFCRFLLLPGLPAFAFGMGLFGMRWGWWFLPDRRHRSRRYLFNSRHIYRKRRFKSLAISLFVLIITLWGMLLVYRMYHDISTARRPYSMIDLIDEDGMVRVMAARSLYRIKSTRDIALPVLVEGLRDEDKRVRRLADSTLRMWDSIIRTGEPLENAVPALIEVLRDEEDKSVLVRGWSVRDIVARTLWEIGTPEAIEAVEEYDKSR